MEPNNEVEHSVSEVVKDMLMANMTSICQKVDELERNHAQEVFELEQRLSEATERAVRAESEGASREFGQRRAEKTAERCLTQRDAVLEHFSVRLERLQMYHVVFRAWHRESVSARRKREGLSRMFAVLDRGSLRRSWSKWREELLESQIEAIDLAATQRWTRDLDAARAEADQARFQTAALRGQIETLQHAVEHMRATMGRWMAEGMGVARSLELPGVSSQQEILYGGERGIDDGGRVLREEEQPPKKYIFRGEEEEQQQQQRPSESEYFVREPVSKYSEHEVLRSSSSQQNPSQSQSWRYQQPSTPPRHAEISETSPARTVDSSILSESEPRHRPPLPLPSPSPEPAPPRTEPELVRRPVTSVPRSRRSKDSTGKPASSSSQRRSRTGAVAAERFPVNHAKKDAPNLDTPVYRRLRAMQQP